MTPEVCHSSVTADIMHEAARLDCAGMGIGLTDAKGEDLGSAELASQADAKEYMTCRLTRQSATRGYEVSQHGKVSSKHPEYGTRQSRQAARKLTHPYCFPNVQLLGCLAVDEPDV